jgi:hypothetical protein
MKLLISEVGMDDVASEKGSNCLWGNIRKFQEELSRVEIQVTLMYETLMAAWNEKQ